MGFTGYGQQMSDAMSSNTMGQTANMFQTNQSAVILNQSFEVPHLATGLIMMILAAIVIIGGIKRTATARAQGVTTLGIIDREFLDKEFNKLSAQFRTILVSITYRFKKMLERACEYTSRTEARIPKALTLSFKDRDAFIRAYTGNISAGGLFIKTENPLGPGRQFQLKLQLPGVEKAIQVKCEVVWSRKRESSTPEKPSGMGVKFSEIAEKDYKLIKRYLESPNV